MNNKQKLSIDIVLKIDDKEIASASVDVLDVYMGMANDISPYNGIDPIDELIGLIEYEISRKLIKFEHGVAEVPRLICVNDEMREAIKIYITSNE